MVSSEKQVNIKVETEANLKNIEALEVKIKDIQKQRIQANIDINQRNIDETKAKITELENKKLELDVDADASEITKIDDEIDKLNSKVLDLELNVESGELEKAKAEAEDLDGTSIDVDVNNLSAMEAIDQIGQGFDRLKQGASEVGEQMGSLLESAGKQETNKTFLEMQLGAEGAATALNDINGIVQKLPGDDTALQGLLSQAAAKNASMTASELENMGVAAADYFSAMSYYGKSATESQQDMLNYLLAGNVAEIERSPILSQHVDDLKNATTVQERSVALQKALTEEGWGGMSMQDTYNNKLETFNGMLERGRYNLGGMFMEGASGAMDFVMQLDSATGGLVGIGIAAASLASPITDTVIGLGQMVMALHTIGEIEAVGKMRQHLHNLGAAAKSAALDLFNLSKSAVTSLKSGLVSLAGTVKEAAFSLATMGKEALLAGANAVKSAAMWAIEQAALVAHKIASYASAAAQWALNIAMDANPIMLVVLAIGALIAVLGYLYFNNEQVRAAIDGLGQSLMYIGQIIWGFVTGAIQWLSDLFNQFTQQLGLNTNDWTQAVLAFILFIPTLPGQVAIALTNTIARALGFKGNFVQTMISAASQAVSNFASWISQLPGKLKGELDKMISDALNFASRLPQIIGDAAKNAIGNWIGITQEHSPGLMYDRFSGELAAMEKAPQRYDIAKSMADVASDMMDSFNPELDYDIGTLEAAMNNSNNDANKTTIINLSFEGCMFDKDERVQEIEDVINKKINWNNVTAGRVV